MKTLIICISVCVCSIVHASMPFGAEFDGRYWSTLDERTKPIFLAGFCVGADLSGFGNPQTGLNVYPEQIPKLIPLLDAFYKAHPEPNMLLRSATEICLMQLNGRPQTEIEEKIRQAQKPWK